MGMAIGEASSVVPVYIAECADKQNRGALATIPQLCISSGILLAYSVSLTVTLCFKGAWRLMMGFALVPALVQVMISQSVSRSLHASRARGRSMPHTPEAWCN